MTAKISPWLPGLPPEMVATRMDRSRANSRGSQQVRIRAGYVLVQSRIHASELDYLMQAWQSPSQADLIRMALRYLLRQTQGGLVRIELPPEL